MILLSTVLAVAVLFLCLYAAINDISRLTIPNWLNGLIAALGFAALGVSGLPLAEIGIHVGIALAVFVVSFILFSFGVFGGGDAKMIPAVALWMGPVAMAPFMFWMALIGGMIGIVGIVSKKAPLPHNAPTWMWNALSKGEGLPYGVAIAGGVFVAAPHSPLFQSALNSLNLIG
ncbi:MAG: prepilin peptidase [Pseudomonadota bacterium]